MMIKLIPEIVKNLKSSQLSIAIDVFALMIIYFLLLKKVENVVFFKITFEKNDFKSDARLKGGK
jgi:hypothetical protein